MKILSWNIYMYIRKYDPVGYTELIINEIKYLNRDILFLQETSEYFLSELFKNTDYIEVAKVLTHGGYCVTCVKKGISVEINSIRVYQQTGIYCKIENVSMVNCHLVPYKNEKMRQIQIEYFAKSKPSLIIGDTNMSETETITGYRDAAIESKDVKNTWFCKYFNKHSDIEKRYDRVYMNNNIKNYTFSTHTEYSYLSDHVPISIEILDH